MQSPEKDDFELPKVDHIFHSEEIHLWSDVTGLIAILHSCFEKISASQRKAKIGRILTAESWYVHYENKVTGRRILSETEFVEHQHELITAIHLTIVGYDVLFAPKAMFSRTHKKFDIFLIKDTVILKADLKSITSKNPDTIAKRIKTGSDQASRVVVHIISDIEKKTLINGLKSGVERNELLKEILLFYKKGFYRLPKNLVLSKRIFDVIK